LDLRLGGVYLLQHRDAEGCGLAGAVLGARQDVAAGQGNGYALLLNGRWLFEALLVDAHEQLPLEEVVLKVVALGGRHILWEAGSRR
jgi:hypothetical protein